MYESYLADLQSDALADDAVAPAASVEPQANLPMLQAEPNIVLPGGITIPRKVAVWLLLAAIAGLIWYIKKNKK